VFTLARGVWSPAGWAESVLPHESIAYIEPGQGWLFPRALGALVQWSWYREVPVLVPPASRALDIGGSLALALAAGLVLVGSWRVLRDPAERLGRTSALAVAAFVPLWLVWDVGNFEHTVAAAPLFGVLVAVGAASLPPRAGSAALAALVLLLASVNGIGGAALQRRPENGRLWITAGFVQQHVSASGLILGVGTDPRVRLGLSYLAGRHVADLTLAVRSARIAGHPPEDGLRWWIGRARGASELWALGDVFDPRTEAWIDQLGIPREAWRAALADLSTRSTAELVPDGAVVREPFRLHRL
jgi:hypothetical protein